MSELPAELTRRFTSVEASHDPEPLVVPASSSVLDAVKRRRREHAVEHVYHVPVAGWGGLLALRCHAPDAEALAGMIDRVDRSKDPYLQLNMNADLLIDATDDVVVRLTPAAAWEPVDPAGPVGITGRLAELLEIPNPSGRARTLLVALFDVPSPELAIGAAVGDYMVWARGADEEIAEELRGES